MLPLFNIIRVIGLKIVHGKFVSNYHFSQSLIYSPPPTSLSKIVAKLNNSYLNRKIHKRCDVISIVNTKKSQS